MNTYAYAANNPVINVDPDGLRWVVNRPTRQGMYTTASLGPQASSLINKIRRIDPAFQYNTWRPAGQNGRLGPRDIRALKGFLNNAKAAGFCGSGASLPRPAGTPFKLESETK